MPDGTVPPADPIVVDAPPAIPGTRGAAGHGVLTGPLDPASPLDPVRLPELASLADPASDRAALARGLCRVMRAIHRRGWCEGTGGNFSCVLDRSPLRLLMAPSGVDKGNVAPADLLVVDEAARVVEGKGRASAETLLHLEILHATRAGAVLHTHSQSATLLSAHFAAGWATASDTSATPSDIGTVELRDLEMLKGLEGITTHDTVVQLPVLANDQDLSRLSAAARPHLQAAPHGLLIAGHGLYAWGRDLSSAQRHLEILEFLLEQRWRRLLLSALCQTGS